MPVIELQPGAQVGAKPGAFAAAVDSNDSFSATFGESLRESAAERPQTLTEFGAGSRQSLNEPQVRTPLAGKVAEGGGADAEAAEARAAGNRVVDPRAAEVDAAVPNSAGPRAAAPRAAARLDVPVSSSSQALAQTGSEAEDPAASESLAARTEEPLTLPTAPRNAAQAGGKAASGITAGPSGAGAKAIAGQSNFVKLGPVAGNEPVTPTAQAASPFRTAAVPESVGAAIVPVDPTAVRAAPTGPETVPETALERAEIAGTGLRTEVLAGAPLVNANSPGAVKTQAAATSKVTSAVEKDAATKSAAGKGPNTREAVGPASVTVARLEVPSPLVAAIAAVDVRPATPVYERVQASSGTAGAKVAGSAGSAATNLYVSPNTAGARASIATAAEALATPVSVVPVAANRVSTSGTTDSEAKTQVAKSSTTAAAGPAVAIGGTIVAATTDERVTTAPPFTVAIGGPSAAQVGEGQRVETITQNRPSQPVGRSFEAARLSGPSAGVDAIGAIPNAAGRGIENAATPEPLKGPTIAVSNEASDPLALQAAGVDGAASKQADRTAASNGAASSGAKLEGAAGEVAAKSSDVAHAAELSVPLSTVQTVTGVKTTPGFSAPNLASHGARQVAASGAQTAARLPSSATAQVGVQKRAIADGDGTVALASEKAVPNEKASAAGISAVRPAAEEPSQISSKQADPSTARQGGSRENAAVAPDLGKVGAAANEASRDAASAGTGTALPASGTANTHALSASGNSNAPVADTSSGAVAIPAGTSGAAAVHSAVPAAWVQAGVAAGVPAAASAAASDVTAGAGQRGAPIGGVAGAVRASVEAARTDLTTIAEPHRTLSATPTTLEVGVPDGTQGWLRIRAEVGAQGEVNAALTAPSSASQEMLHRELPALNAYLHSEQVAVTATVAERSFAGAGTVQGAAEDGSGRSSMSGSGLTHGGTAGGGETSGGLNGGLGGGQSGGPPDDAGRLGAATRVDGSAVSDVTRSYDGSAGLSETGAMNAALSGESGQWLNVRA